MRNLILEFLDTHGDNGRGNDKSQYHKQKQKEHEGIGLIHTSRSTHSQDKHADAARAHRLAASNHQLAYMAHRHDSDNEEKVKRRTDKAESLSTAAHAASKIADDSKNESTVVEFVDSKGDFGGSGSKRDYHIRMHHEHMDHYQHHLEHWENRKHGAEHIPNAKAHWKAGRTHWNAAQAHASASEAHKHDRPSKHEASKQAESKSEEAHGWSAKTKAGD